MCTKIIISVLVIFFSAFSLKAQVAINTDNTTANSSAMLDVKSTAKGVLIPRMTTAQRTAISSPANGLLVYDATTLSFWFYDSGNSGWTELVTAAGASELDDLSDAIYDGSSLFIGNGSGANDDGTSNENTAIGKSALSSNTSGSRNVALGEQSLQDNQTGSSNTAIGVWSLSNSTGNGNVAVGFSGLVYNTTGAFNVAMGFQASRYNSTGNNNVSLGYNSAHYNSTGSNNLVLGYKAGYGVSGSSYSSCVLLGHEAGYNNTSSNKLFIDNSSTSTPLIGGDFSTDQVDINGTIKITGGTPGAGKVLTSDADGLASWSTPSIDDLSDAIYDGSSLFIGNGSGANDDGTSNENTAIGKSALSSNTFGSRNVALGEQSLHDNQTGSSNTAIGVWSLSNSTGNGNVAVGFSGLVYNTTGAFNVAIGYQASRYNSTGNNNISLGYNSAHYNSTGSNNLVLGYNAGYGVSGSSYSGCVLLGYEAGYNNTSSNKLFIDNSSTSTPLIGGDFSTDQVDINGTIKITGGTPGAGKVLTSDADGLASWTTPSGATKISDLSDADTDNQSVFLGTNAGAADDGSNYNTAVGINGLHNTTSGTKNTSIGYAAGNANITGTDNTYLGYACGYYNTGSENTTVGVNAGRTTNGNSYDGCVLIGFNAGYNNTSSNKLFIDNSSTSTPLIGGDFNADELYLNADVGIGTESPNELLEVAGTTTSSGRMIVSDGGGSSREVILFVSPDDTHDYARIDAYDYGSNTGKTLRINATGDGDVMFGGNVLTESHKSANLGASGNAWDNVYADDFVNQGAAAFTNISVTQELLNHQPQEKKDGDFDEFTDKGAKELDPASLPESLTQENSILIDEMTTYNYKANYEQQQQIEALKKENEQLKALLLQMEQRMSAIENNTQTAQR